MAEPLGILVWQLESKYLFFTKDNHILVDMDGSNSPNFKSLDLSERRLGYLCPAMRHNLPRHRSPGTRRELYKRRIMALEWLDESPKNTS